MINEAREFFQLGGTLATVILFLRYLTGKDELNKKTYEQFNQTIENHLHASDKIIEKNNNVMQKLAINMKELCIIIKKLNNK